MVSVKSLTKALKNLGIQENRFPHLTFSKRKKDDETLILTITHENKPQKLVLEFEVYMGQKFKLHYLFKDGRKQASLREFMGVYDEDSFHRGIEKTITHSGYWY